MSAVRAYVAAAAGMVRRDASIFLSYRFRSASQLLTGFFSIVLFYYVSRIVGSKAFPTPDDYFAFVVVGLVVMQVLAATMGSLPVAIRQELVARTLERLVVSPFGAVAAVVSMTIFPFVLAFLNGIVSIAFAALVFGMPIHWSTAPLAIPVAVLGAFAFAPFALGVAASVVVVKQAGMGAGLLTSGIALVGGFLFPVALLPGWIRWLSDVQPFTPALQLLRHLLSDTPMSGSPWWALVKIVAFTVVLLPLSVAALHAAVRAAQRRGTITEY